MSAAAIDVVKVGGNVIDDPARLTAFLRQLKALPGPVVLVHGGGKLASALGRSMGIEPTMVDGRRITDEATLRVVTMTYAGWIGKNIAAELTAMGRAAISICGADGGLLPSVRRSPVPIDFGFVGDPSADTADPSVLNALLDAGFTPVVAPITADASGQLLNTNADTVAAVLAMALARIRPTRLFLAFEKEGVLDADGVVIPALDAATTARLVADGTVKEGMRPKLDAGFRALEAGVREVRVGAADALSKVLHDQAPHTRLLP